MNYGQKIAELRKNKNLTQAELGEHLNITAQAVSKWENNLSEPDIDSLRKMCELFGISVDEFLGISTSKPTEEIEKTEEKTTQEPVKAILGYCECCNKAVCAGEYKTTQLEYEPTAVDDRVKKTDSMHTYCNDCYNKILSAQQQDIQKKACDKIIAEKEEKKREFKKGIKRGIIWGVIAAILFFGSYFSQPSSDALLGSFICTYATFALACQLCWDCFLADFFFFFMNNFKSPFGIIFEFSLDGFIFLIATKLILWAAFKLLSIFVFAIGFILSFFLCMITFPFTLIKKINIVRA